jgi:hypothetical protein
MKEMKIKRKDEELIKVGYRIPANLKNKIEAAARMERRSENDQVIVLFERALSTKEAKA